MEDRLEATLLGRTRWCCCPLPQALSAVIRRREDAGSSGEPSAMPAGLHRAAQLRPTQEPSQISAPHAHRDKAPETRLSAEGRGLRQAWVSWTFESLSPGSHQGPPMLRSALGSAPE